MTQQRLKSLESQRKWSALQRLSLALSDEAQPRRAFGAWRRPVVFREHAAHDILVEIHAERMRDRLRDAHTAELGIAALHFDDRRDEFWSGAFGTGFSATEGGGKEGALFPINQCLVELE